jgi:glyoxylase-like metal-dependent hydrolase (beta-lactamase superfamily II)
MSGTGRGSVEFIRIERLSDRVVIGYWLGTGRMNIVAIKSKKGLAIIDTAMSPRIMAPIKERLERELGRDDWTYVINTHAHIHHAGGNCLFKDAVVIGHDNLPDDMEWLIRRQSDETSKRKVLDDNARTIRNLQALLPQVANNRLQTRRIQGEIKFYQLNTQDIEEGFEIIKPTVTFSDKHTLDLGDLQLELVYFGKGHSLSDILIYIPQEGLLVTGAIVYLRRHLPGITERAQLKDVHRYITVLDAFLEEGVKIDHVVASHSRPLKRNDLKHVRDYYKTMLDGIRAAQQEGFTLEQAGEHFAVQKKFPFFFQRKSAQWVQAKQDRNIKVLWHLLKEAN